MQADQYLDTMQYGEGGSNSASVTGGGGRDDFIRELNQRAAVQIDHDDTNLAQHNDLLSQ